VAHLGNGFHAFAVDHTHTASSDPFMPAAEILAPGWRLQNSGCVAVTLDNGVDDHAARGAARAATGSGVTSGRRTLQQPVNTALSAPRWFWTHFRLARRARGILTAKYRRRVRRSTPSGSSVGQALHHWPKLVAGPMFAIAHRRSDGSDRSSTSGIIRPKRGPIGNTSWDAVLQRIVQFPLSSHHAVHEHQHRTEQ